MYLMSTRERRPSSSASARRTYETTLLSTGRGFARASALTRYHLAAQHRQRIPGHGENVPDLFEVIPRCAPACGSATRSAHFRMAGAFVEQAVPPFGPAGVCFHQGGAAASVGQAVRVAGRSSTPASPWVAARRRYSAARSVAAAATHARAGCRAPSRVAVPPCFVVEF